MKADFRVNLKRLARVSALLIAAAREAMERIAAIDRLYPERAN